MLTIVDGDARVIDGVRCLAAVPGLRLSAQTLVETGPQLRLLRVEWPDGSVADFGPDTHAMLSPVGFGQREQRAPAFYLLRGWVKHSAMGSATGGGHISLGVDVQSFKGAVVSFAGPVESWVFLESGSARIVERYGRNSALQALKSGEVYLRAGLDKGSVAPQPSSAQLQRVPRGFRDTLPTRSAAFKDQAVAGKPLPLPTYAEMRGWLTAEPALRKSFPLRFAARTREPAFREAMLARIAEHPEWASVLHPQTAASR